MKVSNIQRAERGKTKYELKRLNFSRIDWSHECSGARTVFRGALEQKLGGRKNKCTVGAAQLKAVREDE